MKKIWKKIAAAGLAAVTALSLLAGTAIAQEADTVYRTVDEIKESGTINIGVFSDKAPFGYVDEYGKYQGYDIYFAERIGEDLGVEINYVSTEAASRIEYLQTGKVDIILANFTVTEERAQEVDFALPYMNVALGVVSPNDRVITDLSEIGSDDRVIVISGTTAETYLVKNNPEITLQKFDTYASAKEAFENGTGVAWANDNTEVIAFAIENEGYTVGIDELGNADTIAPAVSKGNESLLNWLNEEIKSLGEEKFFHAAYEATLAEIYGLDYEDTDTFSDEISYYESLMDSAGMEWIEVHISTWDEFTEFWQHMKNYRPDGTYGELEYYSGVDNLIIECHGNESGLLFDPYDGYQGINIIDYGLLGSLQSAHINVLNLWSCFSAYTRGETSAAREAVLNLDVDDAYGWSGLVYYDPVVNMSYYA